ncbi:collagen alpha-4(VI) chain-like isoform X1 [Physella acuta]|uniref:collagen alpha-4(VI) chain-like isoform X1 n=1 Tax=Physella acuta TaxID=109671 RepID=UPI0027DB9B02|nr:collagen alpha-4(VI) chain-like isoform X1 [Physella acuta]XP_059152340.1 collagen alpha-4(VI) chain-like isoform X1 [Physella acuta]XP_059152408.1 collagen alpha-4(VI) chain-like isoform X1 [Physella acuta]
MNTKTAVLLFVVLSACITGSYQQTQCIGSLDIIFAVDGSNSMGEQNFIKQRTTLVNLVNRLTVSDSEIHIGLCLFSNSVTETIALSGNKVDVIKHINNLTYPDEQTRTDLAIDRAIEMFSTQGRGPSVPKLLMVITDGASTKPLLTQSSAATAKARNITIYAVGVTAQIDRNELESMASKKETVVTTNDFTTLEGSLVNATNRACVDVECYDAQVDLVFVLDSTNNIGAQNFQEMISFVQDFLIFAFVDNGNFRVGVMTLSDQAYVEFQMTRYDRSKKALSSALNSIPYRTGYASKTEAFAALKQNMYTTANGDRKDVPNVVILLTSNTAGSNVAQIISEAEGVRAQGIQIFAVGIGLSNTQELDGIASKPLIENRFTIPNFYQLRPVIEQVYKKFNRFCETPPPVPACYMGDTDLWFVVDVSSKAETMSRQDFPGDFARLKNGLTKLMDIVMDPSVSNPGIHTGLVTYSDTVQVAYDVSSYNSVSQTAQLLRSLPGGLRQGGSYMTPALRAITNPPRATEYKSYVVIVAPETAYTSDAQGIQTEIARLKNLGYTIVPFVVKETGVLNQYDLMSRASGSNYFYGFNSYSELEAAAKNFTRDRLCNGYVGSPSAGLCANSGHKENGMSLVPHPSDCDKYVQCYYNNLTNLDLGVVRQCPMGLFWSQQNKTCSPPNLVQCPYDHCKEDCEPYKMEGACGAYWECENGVSSPKCCQEYFSFVPGIGCQLDFTCRDKCGPEKWCGICQKKPNWVVASGYDVQLMNGVLGWMPRPCFYEDFDVVDCECSAPRNQVCPPDREYNFMDAATVKSVQDGRSEGIRVSTVSSNNLALVLNSRSAVHVDVNKMATGDEPFVIKFVYKENTPFSPYGQTLYSSGVQCGNGNALIVSSNDQFVFAEIRASDGRVAEVKVPTKGFSMNDYKNVTLSYNEGVLSLSISTPKQEYIAQTKAPAHMCFSCGIDIGAGLNKNSFDGEVQKISVHSCSLSKLY